MMQMVVGINAKQHAQPMQMANGAQNKILMDVNQAGVTLENFVLLIAIGRNKQSVLEKWIPKLEIKSQPIIACGRKVMDVPITVQLIVVKKKPCVQENWILLDVKSQIIVIIANFVQSTVTGKRK